MSCPWMVRSWFSPRFDAGPVKGPTVIYCLQHKGLRRCLARMIASMRRFDAGGQIDERNSPVRGIKHEVRFALLPAPAVGNPPDFASLAPAPIIAVDPNL